MEMNSSSPTDRWTNMTKLNSSFRKFAKVPKKSKIVKMLEIYVFVVIGLKEL